VHATVLIPTTADRGPLLPYSIGSVQAQTVTDIEIFVMGDGITEETRQVIQDLARSDPRIRFFGFPKHSRRGEPYRHEALQQARGDMVCYLCDRDLMLPDHVEVMRELLREHDFAHTLPARVRTDGRLDYGLKVDLKSRYYRRKILHGMGMFGLSYAGHTLEMYRRLPFGWRTTPSKTPTDHYMWQQFLAHPECRAVSSDELTILSFNRGRHPGWTVAQRLPELQAWSAKLDEPGWYQEFRHTVPPVLARPRMGIARRLRSFHRNHRAFADYLRRHALPRRVWEKLIRYLGDV